ncbi:MAG: GNAT family N-acetyltransferase [Candidatus Omnitrophica bacterium]|nr:GNAT family N-acetyltransferase [Candidatus Omnitrophota bacterium]
MLRIKEISSYEQFKDMKKAWGDLISRSQVDNIYLTYDWINAHISHCCDSDRLMILTVLDGDTLTGIAPLIVRKNSFMGITVRSVCFIGTRESDRMDFILSADTDKEESLLSIMDYLMGIEKDWDLLDFQEITRSSGTIEMIKKVAKLRKLKFVLYPENRSFFIKFNCNMDYFLNKISKKLDKKMKKLNKTVKTGLKFEHYPRNEVKESLYSDIRFIAERSWKAQRDKSIFLKKETKSFHKELFLDFARSGYMDISILRMDDTPIAYRYNFLYNGRLYGYSMDFDIKYAYISPGTMLTLWSIEKLASIGIKEIDFGRGEEEWKMRLTQDFRMHEKIQVFNNSFYGKNLYLFYSCIKCIKKNKALYGILRKAKQGFL